MRRASKSKFWQRRAFIMAAKLRSWFVDQFGRNLKLPQGNMFGSIAARFMLKNNTFLEKNAVEKAQIHPDHKVLEIGFGPGVGLETAYNIVKKGKGVVYGIDTSMFMVDKASKRLRKPMQMRKVLLFHGSATHIPLNTDSINRVFHCNCYYFWPSMRSVMREIYRVMKPGGMMITTLSLDLLSKNKQFLQHARPDPVKYMTCLENYGFEGVHLEYHTDKGTGKTYQVIYAEVREKPAHDQSMLSDDEGDDDLQKEEFLLRDKEEYKEYFNKSAFTNPKTS